MDPLAVGAAFSRQLRRELAAAPGMSVERDELVTRVVGDGWNGVVWSDLGDADADAVIAREATRFEGRSREWKHYSGDCPADLPERLLGAGFVADPPESVMVAEIADLDLRTAPPDGVELVIVRSNEDVEALVHVHDEVFGRDHAALGREVAAAVGTSEPALVAVLAQAEDKTVSAGRVEFHAGTEFASLCCGGTLPDWRRRGVFRAVVAKRAALAADRGFRYLQWTPCRRAVRFLRAWASWRLRPPRRTAGRRIKKPRRCSDQQEVPFLLTAPGEGRCRYSHPRHRR